MKKSPGLEIRLRFRLGQRIEGTIEQLPIGKERDHHRDYYSFKVNLIERGKGRGIFIPTVVLNEREERTTHCWVSLTLQVRGSIVESGTYPSWRQVRHGLDKR